MNRTERDILEEIEAIIDGKIDDAQERAKVALRLSMVALDRKPRNDREVGSLSSAEAFINGELVGLGVIRDHIAECLRNMEPDGSL